MSSASSTTVPAAPAPAPSIADLQAEVAAAREELVATLGQLKAEATPGAMVKRGGRAVLGWFTDEYGGIRPERVAIAGAAVVGVIVLRAITRRR